MEAAASARQRGNDVVILERGDVPLASALGAEMGAMFAELHAENGVTIRSQVTVSEIVGEGGHVTSVSLYGGDSIPADVVIAAIGVTPNIDLALNSGLDTTDDGVRVDASLRTNDPAIFAAGDIACVLHPDIHKRLHSEHWQNAISTGEAAARAMLGKKVSYDAIPYFFTDQFDLGMEFSGYAPLMDGAELIFRGDRDAREFIVFWLANQIPVAGMNVNVWDVNDQVQRLIRQGTAVDAAALENPDVPLDTL
jgi:NADPH-dependent 2,4-dienoyl-CoA reductase/sulfur reductase-like enzyme